MLHGDYELHRRGWQDNERRNVFLSDLDPARTAQDGPVELRVRLLATNKLFQRHEGFFTDEKFLNASEDGFPHGI
jgi:hypothetical protein